MIIPHKTCLVCETPLTAIAARTGVLCGSAMCAWKYRATPVLQRCVVCGRALSTAQLASRTCASADCQRAWLVDRPIAYHRRKLEELGREATAVRERVAAEHGIDNVASYTVTLVPRNRSPSSRLTVRRKRKFREHLRTTLNKAIDHRAAVAKGTEQPRPPLPPLVPPAAEVAGVLLQGCIGCRGYCCRTGGEHAYITPYTMLAQLEARPPVSDERDRREEIVEAYMAYLPERSMTEGCIYQGTRGCVLPRDMRGDTCNRFFCDALKEFQAGLKPGEEPRAFFVPVHDLRFQQVAFAKPDFVQIARHRSTTMDV